MQNSIWKLTALAGVAGIGFLVVLQTQRGMTRRGDQGNDTQIVANTAPNELVGDLGSSDNNANDSLYDESSDSLFVSNVAEGQTEPELMPNTSFTAPDNARSAVTLGAEFVPDGDVKSFSEVTQSEFPKQVKVAKSSDNGVTHLFGENNDFTTQSSSRLRNTTSRQLLLDPNPVAQTKRVGSNNVPESPRLLTNVQREGKSLSATSQGDFETPNSIPSDQRRAKELVREARLDLNARRIETARQKALQAIKLNVTFDVLEDQPELILFDIDRLSATLKHDQAVVQTGRIEKPAATNSASKAISQSAESTGELNGPRLFQSLPEQRSKVVATPFARQDALRYGADAVVTSTAEAGLGKAEGVRPRFDEQEVRSPGRVSAAAVSGKLVVSSGDALKPPRRLELPLGEIPLSASNSNDDLQGDDTISKDAPRGPQRPQLTIEKMAPPTGILGQPMVYSVIIKNQGTSSAHQVVVEDIIPKGTELVGTIPRAELTGNRLVWRIGTLKPSEDKKISVKIIPTAEGQIGSVATVNFVAEVTAETRITSPNLELELSAPKQAELGDPVNFQFMVRNIGTGDATGVVVRDVIPNGLRHPDGNDLEYDVGTLAVGASRTLTITLTAAQIGQTVNRATVTADGGHSIEAVAAVEISGSQLLLSRTGPVRKYIGRAAVFGTTVTNDSEKPVFGITVVETLSKGMQFTSASAAGQFNTAKRTVAWRIEKLDPKQRKVLSVTLVPKILGSQSSIITASAASGERTEMMTVTEVIGIAALVLDFSETDGVVARGESIPIQLSVRNRGSSPASNVSVKIAVPSELQFVSAEGPVKHSVVGSDVRFQPIGKINGKSAAVFDLHFTAQQAGDARLSVHVESDQLSRPLTEEEAIMIFSDNE